MIDSTQNRIAFAELLKTTAEVYGKDLSNKLIAIYFSALNHYELDELQNALNLHLRNTESGQFMPKPADIVRLIDGGSETSALEAWTKVEKAIRHVGGYESVVFDDPKTMAVINEMGGWIKLCEILEKELPFRANEFQKRFRAYVLRGGVKDFPKRLAGLAEVHNQAEGQPIESPLMTGNQEKAALVYQSGKSGGGLHLERLDASSLIASIGLQKQITSEAG